MCHDNHSLICIMVLLQGYKYHDIGKTNTILRFNAYLDHGNS